MVNKGSGTRRHVALVEGHGRLYIWKDDTNNY